MGGSMLFIFVNLARGFVFPTQFSFFNFVPIFALHEFVRQRAGRPTKRILITLVHDVNIIPYYGVSSLNFSRSSSFLIILVK